MMRTVIGKSGSKAVHELATLDERTVQGAALPGTKAATHLEMRKTQDALVERLNSPTEGHMCSRNATDIGYRSIFPDKASTSSQKKNEDHKTRCGLQAIFFF